MDGKLWRDAKSAKGGGWRGGVTPPRHFAFQAQDSRLAIIIGLMITSLSITNFRGLHGVEIADIPQFTLITGQNGVGKTSLLEAGMLLAGRRRPAFLASLQARRGLGSISIEEGFDLRGFFSSYGSVGTATVEGIEDDRPVRVEVIRGKEREMPDQAVGSADTSTRRGIDLRIESFYDGQREMECKPVVHVLAEDKVAGVEFTGQLGGKNAIILWPLAGTPIEEKDIERFGEVETRGDVDKVVEMMQILNPAIESLHTISERRGQVLKVRLKGQRELQPLGLLGGGVQNAFRAITSLAWVQDGWFGWDEIENGLHKSIQKDVFRALFGHALTTGAQIMMSTHSGEALRAVAEAANETPEEDFAVLNVRRATNGLIKVDRIGESSAIAALASGYDLR